MALNLVGRNPVSPLMPFVQGECWTIGGTSTVPWLWFSLVRICSPITLTGSTRRHHRCSPPAQAPKLAQPLSPERSSDSEAVEPATL